MVNRHGASKSMSEVNDISGAFKLLSEKGIVPAILATSDMVAQTPIYNSHPSDGDSSEVNNRLKVIEESMNSIIEANKIG